MADWRDDLALLEQALKAQANTLGTLGNARAPNAPMLAPDLPRAQLQELDAQPRGGFAAGSMTLPMLGHNAFARGSYEAYPGAPANWRMMFGLRGQF